MKTFRVVWSPSAEQIAVVDAMTARAAIRKAIKGTKYRKYPGECYAEEV